MFLQRLIVAIVLLPLALALLFAGELHFTIFMAVVSVIAVWEYSKMFKIGGYAPADFVLYAGVLAIFAANQFVEQNLSAFIFIVFSLILVAWHLYAYEKGRSSALIDLIISIFGLFLIGFLGGYFVLLRGLPGGSWWILTVLTSVWWADSGGYFIGSWKGKNLISPRISPKKTWEGYIAGIGFTLVGSPLLLFFYKSINLPVDDAIGYVDVVVIAATMGFGAILGDLLVSLIKLYFDVKDTGKILLGHGGILDRMDAWLWAVAIGYYLITVIILS